MGNDRDDEISKRVLQRVKKGEILEFAEMMDIKYGFGKIAAFPPDVVRQAFKKANGQCECDRTTCAVKHAGRCPQKFKFEDRGHGLGKWQAHHWVAQSKGGSDEETNCEILCVPCHKSTDSYGRPDDSTD